MPYKTSPPPEESNLDFMGFPSKRCPKCGGSCSSGGCNSGGPYGGDEKKRQHPEYTVFVSKSSKDKDWNEDANGGYGSSKDGVARR